MHFALTWKKRGDVGVIELKKMYMPGITSISQVILSFKLDLTHELPRASTAKNQALGPECASHMRGLTTGSINRIGQSEFRFTARNFPHRAKRAIRFPQLD